MSDEIPDADAVIDYTKLKVSGLKKLLKARGLSMTGNKVDLVQRLQQAQTQQPSDELLEEDCTGDSEVDEELEEDLDEAILSDEKDAGDGGGAGKRKAQEAESTADTAEDTGEGRPPVKAKKVSGAKCKRKVTGPGETQAPAKAAAEPQAAAAEATEEEEEATDAVSTAPDAAKHKEILPPGAAPTVVAQAKSMLKIAELTVKEKIKKRAQKFGLSESAKKELRAARFGIPTQTVMSEVLKKRAERFGIATPTLKKDADSDMPIKTSEKVVAEPNKVELSEKLEARKNRFGAAPPAIQVSDPTDKKAIRAQRFKLAA